MVRQAVSGGQSSLQLCHELKGNKKERDDLLEALGFKSRDISVMSTFTLKTELGLPWSKLRLLRRLIVINCCNNPISMNHNTSCASFLGG